jgi:CubicO group peptidase (beta-lactamase class C family)
MLAMACRVLPLLLLVVVVSAPPGWVRAQQTAPTLPPGDEWQRCTAAEAGFDPALLQAAVSYAREHETKRPRDYSDQVRIFGRPLGPLPASRGGTNGLILRRGCLVAEFGDTRAVEPVYSAAKSFLSTVLGLAVDRGLIRSLDDRVADYVRDGGYDSAHNQAITWRQHAQQTSEWEGSMWGKPHTFLGVEEFGEGARPARDLRAPGTYYEYNDVRINRLALSLLRVWKRPLPEVLRDEVMTPLGASTTWRWIPYDNAHADVDGGTMPSMSGGTRWGGGIWMSSRDLARFGQLFLNRGRWGPRQLVSAEWVRTATTPSAQKPDYGCLWWLNRGQQQWPGTPASSFAAVGFGSNTVWIDPEHDLVVVWRWHDGNGAEFFKRVADAVRPPAATAATRSPVVVELFTSEGCSSCPPADRVLGQLAESGLDGIPIIALSEHVDYWNRQGWTDPFSSSGFTQRQQRYADALKSDVYTPQMVVDGRWQFIGSDRAAAVETIRKAAGTEKLAVAAAFVRQGNGFVVNARITRPEGEPRLPPATVFVAITEDGLESDVLRGENQGRHLTHTAVTRYMTSVRRLADHDDGRVVAKVPMGAWRLDRLRAIVLVQASKDGAVLGAISVSFDPHGHATLE